MIWQPLFDKEVDVQRLKAIADTDNEKYLAHLTDVNCCIQSLDDSPTEDLEGSIGQDFLMFCCTVDINVHDKIIDGEDKYLVMGKEVNDFQGFKNLELRIRKCL
jgi:hypothetical protein